MKDNSPDDRQWTVCCSKTERGFIKYMVQVTFGLAIIIFCMVMMTNTEQNREIYVAMLSSTVGIFLPHPRIERDEVITPSPELSPPL